MALPELTTELLTACSLSPEPSSTAEVIVVGASLGGLQAAYDIQQSGLSCLVIDTKESISYSNGTGAGSCDVGELVHIFGQPRTCELARRLGLKLERRDVSGRNMIEGLGVSGVADLPNLEEDDRRSYIRVRDNVEALCKRVDINRPAQLCPNYGSMSVHELVVSQGATPIVQKLVNTWVYCIFGLSSKNVCALYFLLHCKSAGGLVRVLSSLGISQQRRWLEGGSQKLREELAGRLAPGSICFSQSIQQIHQTAENNCVLTAASGQKFYASKIILAESASCCRTIEFTPELGDDKQWLKSNYIHGRSAKVNVIYEHNWWRNRVLSGNALGVDGPIALVQDTSSTADGCHRLTCILTGAALKDRADMSEEDRIHKVIAGLQTIFGDDIPSPMDIAQLDQECSTWMQGPSNLAVPAANLSDLERDQWQPEGNVHFAGAETSFVWRGHTEGALASGSRAAEEALLSLGPPLETLGSRL